MNRSTTAAVLITIACVLLTVSCTPDRLTDSGCEVDGDCRGERVCVQGRCIDEGRAPDTDADDDGGSDDVEMLDIGSGEDASSTELDDFVGLWLLEGLVEVTNEDGSPLMEPDRQEFELQIEEATDSDADLSVLLPALEECPMLADVGPSGTRFEVVSGECESSPVDEVSGDAEIVEGTGVLYTDGSILEIDLVLEIVTEQDFGTIYITIQAGGPNQDG